jgi:hypothetical protein
LALSRRCRDVIPWLEFHARRGRHHEMASDVVLFIDANQYLNLYGLVAGKRLLDWLEEQQAHVFVSVQIVEEVLRQKLGCAQTFFLDKFKEIDAIKGPIPDHLLAISDEKTAEFKKSLIKQSR